MHALCASAILMAAATSVAAQQRPDTAVLTPVTITASRSDPPQSIATAASTVLLGDALRARGITTVAAALREVPGAALVRAGSPGSQASLFLRGGESDYVQIMIDGVTVNEPGGSFSFANLTLDDVERIEIVRGPASVLYGSDAMTGVIQIFTRAGSAARRGELRAQAAERGGLDLDGSLSGGVAGAAVSVGGGHHRSNGIYTLNNEWRSDAVSGNVRVGGPDRGMVALNARYADARYDYPTESSGAPLDSNSFNTERRLTVGFAGERRLSSAIDGHISAGLSRYQSVSTDPADGPGDFASRFESFSVRRNADARIDVRPHPRATLSLGADLDWQRSEGTGEDSSNPFFRRWSRGGYAQLVGDAARRWTYSLGARVEDNQRFGTFSTVRATAGVRVGPETTLRGAFGTAFKEPTFCELSGCGFADSNAELEPERSRSWEVGIERQLGSPTLLVGATYFDQEFRDLIQFGSTRFENARAAYANGWEIEARAGVGGGPTVRGSFTILDAVIRATGTTPSSRLLRRPRRSASVVASMPAGAGLVLGADYAYVGHRDDNRFTPTPERIRMTSYPLVGLSAIYAPPRSPTRLGRGGRPPVELTVRVDNLLDKEYHAIAGFATPRRTVTAGVRMNFGW